MKTLKTCLAIFRVRAAEGFAYRAAWLSRAVSAIVFALIDIALFTVFYTYADRAAAGPDAGLSLQQLYSYIWLTAVLFAMQPMSVEASILRKIISGDVGVELCRPMNLYTHWFVHTGAGKAAPLLVSGIPIVITGILTGGFGFGLGAPESAPGLITALVSLICAFFLCTAYGTLITAIRLNLTWGEGPTYLMLLIGGVLSGAYMPLQPFPQPVQKLMLYQPFAGYMDIPLRLYVGSAQPREALLLIAVQVVWTAVFIVLGRLVMKKRLSTVVVQGG